MNDRPDKPTPEGVEDPHADVAETRGELGDTGEELAAKPDVKEHAKQQMHAAGDKLHASTEKVAEVAARIKQAAPAPVQHALDEANERLEPVAKKARDRATQNPRQIAAAAAAAALVVWRLVRRLRSGRSR
jgi:type VI protein secretion system component VasK